MINPCKDFIQQLGLREKDVISGRGNGVLIHPGNIFYKSLVKERKIAYQRDDATLQEKNELIAEIFDIVTSSSSLSSSNQHPPQPGRFIKLPRQHNDQKSSSGCDDYEIQGKVEAFKKIAQALREKPKKIRTDRSKEPKKVQQQVNQNTRHKSKIHHQEKMIPVAHSARSMLLAVSSSVDTKYNTSIMTCSHYDAAPPTNIGAAFLIEEEETRRREGGHWTLIPSSEISENNSLHHHPQQHLHPYHFFQDQQLQIKGRRSVCRDVGGGSGTSTCSVVSYNTDGPKSLSWSRGTTKISSGGGTNVIHPTISEDSSSTDDHATPNNAGIYIDDIYFPYPDCSFDVSSFEW
jgi:hypothetical protein